MAASSRSSARTTDAPAFAITGCTYSQHAVARMMTRMRNLDDVTAVHLAKSVRKDANEASGGAAVTADPAQAQQEEDIPDCTGSERVTKFDILVEFGGAVRLRRGRRRRPACPRAPRRRSRTPTLPPHRAPPLPRPREVRPRDAPRHLHRDRDRRARRGRRLLVPGALAEAREALRGRQGRRRGAAGARPGQAGEDQVRAGPDRLPAPVRQPRSPGQGRAGRRGRPLAAGAAEPRGRAGERQLPLGRAEGSNQDAAQAAAAPAAAAGAEAGAAAPPAEGEAAPPAGGEGAQTAPPADGAAAGASATAPAAGATAADPAAARLPMPPAGSRCSRSNTSSRAASSTSRT